MAHVESPADADLVAAARAGDQAALDLLVSKYQPLVFRFGMRMCGDADAAGDVLQDTLLSMTRSMKDFRADSSLSTWLFSVARHACLRKRRRRVDEPARHESLERLSDGDLNTLAAPGRDPEQALAQRETRTALEDAIASLKPPDREVLLLRDVEGLTAPEVAKVLNVGVAAVKSRLHRARLAVREHLEPAFGPPEPRGHTGGCPDVLSMLSRHLEGDLAASTCAEMTAHLEQCPRCRGACDSLKRVLARCRDAAAPQPPLALGAAVRDAIRIFIASQSRGS